MATKTITATETNIYRLTVERNIFGLVTDVYLERRTDIVTNHGCGVVFGKTDWNREYGDFEMSGGK